MTCHDFCMPRPPLKKGWCGKTTETIPYFAAVLCVWATQRFFCWTDASCAVEGAQERKASFGIGRYGILDISLWKAAQPSDYGSEWGVWRRRGTVLWGDFSPMLGPGSLGSCWEDKMQSCWGSTPSFESYSPERRRMGIFFLMSLPL